MTCQPSSGKSSRFLTKPTVSYAVLHPPATDREIDRIVYAFYGLTEGEIAVVDGPVFQAARTRWQSLSRNGGFLPRGAPSAGNRPGHIPEALQNPVFVPRQV